MSKPLDSANNPYEFDFKRVPTLKKFSLDDSFIRGVMGPFGSGKSSACVVELVRRGMEQKPCPITGQRKTSFAVIRNTYRQLSDTTIKTFFTWFPPAIFGTYNKTENVFTIKIDGAEIEILFRALDDDKDIRNLLSLDLTGAWINEAREVRWSIIEALCGRLGRFPKTIDGVPGTGPTWHGLIMDTNPPDDDSEWFNFFEVDKPENAKIFKQPSGLSVEAENTQNLIAGYYKNIAIGKKPGWIDVYVHGKYGYVQEDMPVYPEYSDDVHCVDDLTPIKGVPIRRGWDFGLTPACVFSQLTPKGQLVVLDELVAKRSGIDRFGDAVIIHSNEHFAGFDFIDHGDPAGTSASQTDEKSCFDILASKGMHLMSGDQDLTLRLESVRRPLTTMVEGKPGLLLSSKCVMLRKGFLGKYRYRKISSSGDRWDDKPLKNEFSHPHDALQYTATQIFGMKLTAPFAFGKAAEIEYAEMGIV